MKVFPGLWDFGVAGPRRVLSMVPAQSWSPRQRLASSSHVGRPFSSQAAEDRKEEPLHSIISSSETVQGSVSKHEFQAETKKLLDIVARSLYSGKEVRYLLITPGASKVSFGETVSVFIRELISNASDALEKLRHKLVSEGQTLPEMEIHLQTDAEKGTITIQDTGIGMTQEELVSNLGTIARSGWKAFLDAPQSQAGASSKIIGQFGVGFYSAFMVADRVEVYSRSVDAGSPGYQWLSEGSGVFEIAEASGVRTGTKIIIHLTADSREFTSKARVGDVVTKYSNFVSFPLYLNGRRINTLQAIWLMDPKDTDAPLNIRSIFYAPESKPTMSDVSREPGSSISLYSRQVLIQTKMGAVRHFLRMRQLAEPPEERAQLLQPTLEINPRENHSPDFCVSHFLAVLYGFSATSGLVDDPRPMVSRLNHLLIKALDRH
ncbi:Heat shock protein 75 kDa, mitochondrial, partial [Eschrichtius robustus]|nr:Heat shock protein 75 kDa, mitochondrial [Eschrichtius robustus]